MSNDDSKYFDPATNDFILRMPELTAPDPHPEWAELDPEARAIAELADLTASIEGYRAPFMTADEMRENADVDASALAADIARLYPGRNEIELDGITVSKMIGGSYTVNSFPLRELSTAYLSRLRAAVRGRRY
jgi:hypothetical protein